MANSRFEYVKTFERNDALLPNTYIIVRIDGHAFHKFSAAHGFTKPNDLGALALMNKAAAAVFDAFPEIQLAYGDSDEYSFLFPRSFNRYERRESKLISTCASVFTAAYIFRWSQHFPDTAMKYPPSFDARAVLYPTGQNVRDYFSWRQADCHINNLYNTTFWALIQNESKENKPKLTNTEAQARLMHTFAKDKNEILFKEYGINYNNEDAICRKGTVLFSDSNTHAMSNKALDKRRKAGLSECHVDIIQDDFWLAHPDIL
ncbi:tRNA-histidine guanylyltransferase 1, partial [Protomyces lactucae-debilis]